MDNEYIDETITYLANSIDKKAEDALFNFTGGRVTAFKPSRSGVAVNREKTKKLVMNFLENNGYKLYTHTGPNSIFVNKGYE